MADYAPPAGPPPPKVPEGWKAVWNAQYSEWFFVNIYTKKSQWDKPTEPIYPPGEAPPDGPPPTYAPSTSSSTHVPPTGDVKAPLASNNPYGSTGAGGTSQANISEDEKLARKLQEEEDARVKAGGSNRGAADDFYNQGAGQPQPNQYAAGGAYPQSSSPYPQQGGPAQYQDPNVQDKGKSKGGLLGKLLGKTSSSSHSQPHYQQQGGYGGYQQQGGYGAPPAGYYGGAPQGYYPPGGYAAGRPPRKGGLGAGGAAALGVGGGLLGGALLGEAIADAGDHGGDGGDYGGDGGDFGGDGGGDFGGGDF